MVNSNSKKDETIKEGTEGQKTAKEGFRIPKTYTLGSKEIFELSLRYGIYLKIKGNKQEEVKLPKFIEPKDVTSEELSEIIDGLEKKVKDSLTETKCDDVKVLKSYLPSLMFAVSKIQDKELNYYNSVVNENNKREIEKLMSSIKRKMFREYKQKEELVNSL